MLLSAVLTAKRFCAHFHSIDHVIPPDIQEQRLTESFIKAKDETNDETGLRASKEKQNSGLFIFVILQKRSDSSISLKII